MKSNEGAIIAQVLIDATARGWRLFRNTVGLAFMGGQISEERTIMDKQGRPLYLVELLNARRVRVGLCKGSSDLIGWRPLVITSEMVGSTIAQFAAIEVKTDSYKRTTDEQDNFIEQVRAAGGFAEIAREGENLVLN
jgi:hypothetical protein